MQHFDDKLTIILGLSTHASNIILFLSDQNYPQDTYLKALEDNNHCKSDSFDLISISTGIPLTAITRFNRIRSLTENTEVSTKDPNHRIVFSLSNL